MFFVCIHIDIDEPCASFKLNLRKSVIAIHTSIRHFRHKNDLAGKVT